MNDCDKTVMNKDLTRLFRLPFFYQIWAGAGTGLLISLCIGAAFIAVVRIGLSPLLCAVQLANSSYSA
jgi:hypothetical protein